MLRNLLFYRLPKGFDITPADLEEKLATRRLEPPSKASMQSFGFVPVDTSGQLVLSVEKYYLFEFGMEKRLLPGGVVARALKERTDAWEAQHHHKPGRKLKSTLKEEVQRALMAQAFITGSSIRGWFDLANGWLVIGATARSKAEEVIAALREVLGSLAVQPAEVSGATVSAVMTAWLQAGDVPGRFRLDDSADLMGGSGDDLGTVKLDGHTLDAESVKQLLGEGNRVTRLGLSWNERVRLSLSDNLQIKKVGLLNVEERETRDNEDEFAGAFALFSGEVAAMLGELANLLGLAPQHDASVAA